MRNRFEINIENILNEYERIIYFNNFNLDYIFEKISSLYDAHYDIDIYYIEISDKVEIVMNNNDKSYYMQMLFFYKSYKELNFMLHNGLIDKLNSIYIVIYLGNGESRIKFYDIEDLYDLKKFINKSTSFTIYRDISILKVVITE